MSYSYFGWTSFHHPQFELNKQIISTARDSISYMAQETAANSFALINEFRDDNRNTYISDDCAIAVNGNPYWLDTGLNVIASEKGYAKALFEAFKEFNDDILLHTYGDFSFAIILPKSNEALLAIDRIGINKLYFTLLSSNELVFSTSLDSLTSHPEIGKEIYHQSIYNYLFFHVTPSPDTIYKGIQKLLPGHYLKFKNGQITVQRYWDPVFKEEFHKNTPGLSTELKSLILNAIEKCGPDEYTGAFLSGGLDSSTITGFLAQIQKAKTFTIGFDDDKYNETAYARITSSHFSTLHHEYYVTPQDVCDIISKIAKYYDEPFGNSSAVPAYYCAKLAKDNGIETLLAGDGGDEIFGGNTRYAKQQIFNIYSRLPGLLKKSIIEPLIFNFPYGSKITPIRKIHSYINQANIPLPERLETYNFLLRNPASDIFTEDFLQSIDQQYPFRAMHDVYDSANTDSDLNRMLFLDWKFTLFDNDLQKVNGMCDLAGVNVKYPFLDHEIISFSQSLAPCLKVNGHQLRYFFKYAMSDFLPKEIIYKQKHGFGLPFGIWMGNKKPLKEMAYDSLASLKSRNIVNSKYIDNLVKLHHTEHAAYYGEFIWVLMMLELWFREHI